MTVIRTAYRYMRPPNDAANEDSSLLVSRRSSGLPMEIRINPSGYPACMKVGDLAVVSVEDDPPDIIEGHLGAAAFKWVLRYIALNRDAILDHWAERTDCVELARALWPLPVSRPRRRTRGALLAAVATAGLFVTSATSAQQAGTVVMFYSGNDLLQKCTSADASGHNICAGFVAGVADALDSVSRKGGELAGWRVCRPPDLSIGQVNDVVVQFLQAHPEIRQLTAASLVARALGTAWPHSCP